MNILQCKNLTKKYGDFYALTNVNLSVPNGGGIVGLLGPNGSGKTTLIKLLTGLLQPTEGEVQVAGRPIGVETKAIVSYLSDFYSLNQSYTVQEELQYFSDFFPDFDREKAERMLCDLMIDRTQKVKTLSKGTKEKLALLLTLARKAQLYILDEPIAGVDPAAREYILNTIIGNYNPEATVIITTHLIHDIEPILDDFVFLSYGGKVMLSGNCDAVREETGKSLDELFREVFRC